MTVSRACSRYYF